MLDDASTELDERPPFEDDSDAEPSSAVTAAAAAAAADDDDDDAADAAVERFEAGERADHYEIVRFLAKGGMADIYVARDTKLGRRVALKFIAPSYAARPHVVEAMFAEARAIARFNHPNIVAIHGMGEHRGRPYLALEYLEGNSLRERLREQRPRLGEALRLLAGVADALREAHENGVVHGDLKPRNVVLGTDGRPRVVDFGLARLSFKHTLSASAGGEDDVSDPDATPEGASRPRRRRQGKRLRGTPAYLAPEQWRGELPEAASDIWAFGLMTFELLVGVRPYAARNRAELRAQVLDEKPVPHLDAVARDGPAPPRALVQLCAACLSKQAEQRPAAAEVCAAIDAVRRGAEGGGAGASDRVRAPYRGLFVFGERQANVFFGRDAECAEAVERLRHQPVLPLVGPSGVGKSSLLFAGIVPRLREQGPLLVVRARPGYRPFATLAAELTRATTTRSASQDSNVVSGTPLPPSEELSEPRAEALGSGVRRDLERELASSPARLGMELRALARDHGARVLLAVDQLEEICTHVEDAATRVAFLAAIVSAVIDPAEPVRVVLTLRDDFIGQLPLDAAARRVFARILLVATPGPDALRDAIEKPLWVCGYRFDQPEIVGEMVAEVGGSAVALPLLQHAALELWYRRDRSAKVVLAREYRAMGGVAGALAHHADAVLLGMQPLQVEAVRKVLLRLVTVHDTRRVLPLDELVAEIDGAAEVVETLTGARLLVRRRSRHASGYDVEIVHEALIGAWQRLARWLAESREDRAFIAQVEAAASAWAERGGLDDDLWRGDTLAEALGRLSRTTTPVPPQVRRFVDASVALRQRQRRGRLARWAALLVAVVAVALGVTLVLDNLRRRASRQRDRARTLRAAAELEGAREAEKRGDLVRARAKLRVALEIRDSLGGRALLQRLGSRARLWRRRSRETSYSAAFAGDNTIAVACGDGKLRLVDARTRDVQALPVSKRYITAVAAHGALVAAGLETGDVVLFRREGSSARWRRERVLRGQRGVIWSLAFSRDGRRLASASWDKTVRVYDATRLGQRGAVRVLRGHARRVYDVTFSPDGRQVASVDRSAVVRISDVGAASGQGARPLALRLAGESLYSVGWSRDGKTLALGTRRGRVLLVDAAAAAAQPAASARDVTPRASITAHRHIVRRVAFAPDGRALLSGAHDGQAALFALPSRRVVARYDTRRQPVNAVRFDRRGQRVLVVAYDALSLWRRGPRAARAPHGHRALVWGATFAGGSLYTVGVDQRLLRWDPRSGRATKLLDTGATTTSIAVARAGDALAYGSNLGVVRVHRLSDLTLNRVLIVESAKIVRTLRFDPRGSYLVAAVRDGTLRLWPRPSYAPARTLRTGHRGPYPTVDVSPDGKTIATNSNREVLLYAASAARGGSVAPTKRIAVDDDVFAVRFAASGGALFVGTRGGAVLRIELASGARQTLTKLGGGVVELSVDPGGRWLAAMASRLRARVVDLRGKSASGWATRELAVVDGVSFSADSKLAAAYSGQEIVLLEPPHFRRLWGNPVVALRSARLLGRRGWIAPLTAAASPSDATAAAPLSTTASGSPPVPASRWEHALRRAAVQAALDGDRACLVDKAGHLALYRRSAAPKNATPLGRPLARATGALTLPLRGLWLLAGRCLALGARGRLLAADGLALRDVSAAAPTASGGGLLFASKGRLRRLGSRGGPTDLPRLARLPADPRALAARGRALAALYDGARLRLVATDRRSSIATVTLQGAPGARVSALLLVGAQVVAAGFADGAWGVWSATSGERLFGGHLHGRVVTLVARRDKLLVASEHGQLAVADLGALTRPYCALMHGLWRRVPVVWSAGSVVAREPPREHRCRRRAAAR